jgi:hypothetical protein
VKPNNAAKTLHGDIQVGVLGFISLSPTYQNR